MEWFFLIARKRYSNTKKRYSGMLLRRVES